MGLKQETIAKQDQERTFLIRKNILLSFFLKGGSVLITFLLVPITINYINPVQYGIWLTLSSIIYWISVFDIGIGNGLKNEIAYSIAIKDESNFKKYVSTSYAVLTIIAIIIFVIMLVISLTFDWNKFLNISNQVNLNLRPVIILFIGFFCVQFVLQLLDAVISATQQVFMSSIILLIGQIIGLVSIYLLTQFVSGSLFLLVFVMSGSAMFALLIASLYLYNTKFKTFAPSISSIDFKQIKKLLNFGGTFFIIQIGAMVIIYSNNFIIARILGPEFVTQYNIPFRLFSVISLLFSIIIAPYWSAFTDAYTINNLSWIKKSIKKLRIIWLCLLFLGVLIYIFSNFLYRVWIHNVIPIPNSLSLCMLVNVMVFTWQTLHVYFLNGIGKIRLQLFVVVICAIFNIPLTIYMGKSLGLPGVVSANTIVFFIMGMIFTFQYNKIINQSASKIWNK